MPNSDLLPSLLFKLNDNQLALELNRHWFGRHLQALK